MTPPPPLGVFDSGVGGLSVLAELRRALPGQDLLYLADTAHVPYGARPDDEIRALTERAVAALHAQGAGAVVVACNTASAFSLTHLRERFDMPIIGLVPAVKPAVQATRSGVVGVLATPGTLRGTLLADVIREWAEPAGVQVLRAVSTELVPLVEAGKADHVETRAVLREVLTPLAQAGADQLVLGCTHYPFLAASLRAEFGDTFALLDSGAAVARHTRRVLDAAGLLAPDTTAGTVRYFVTGDPARAAPVFAALLAETMHNGEEPHRAPAPRIERLHT
ncbi:glutamate racemase [Deinococcus multiflagellatus]|uniref:Glutamate racemase n=1 Tax=Deinococcus multiflagellatus TaxID=1656887 RepID=A0ABW1ZMG9_9DEIO|nr:glutamate racemase [Deinococcus multiflagellatus]MBZ9713876.1 glutamate racemase [Deinococcus multiflagellatus]